MAPEKALHIGRESAESTALWVPGIQDCPEDREQLFDLLAQRGLDVQHPDASYEEFDTHEDQPNWIAHKTKVEIQLIQDQEHTVLIATSFGAHRAIKIIDACPQITAAVLLNPPKNEMAKPEKANNTDHASPAEIMLRPLTCDMDDDTFDTFLARHEHAYKHERKRMKRELMDLREGPSFEELLEDCSNKIELLLVQAPVDPWHIQEDLFHPNLQRESMDNTYHYPHVSKPHELADLISTWIGSLQVLNRSESDLLVQSSDSPRDHNQAIS